MVGGACGGGCAYARGEEKTSPKQTNIKTKNHRQKTETEIK
jgi:hypothetical protein